MRSPEEAVRGLIKSEEAGESPRKPEKSRRGRSTDETR